MSAESIAKEAARESAEEFFKSLPEETKYKWAAEVRSHWAFEFAEAYAQSAISRAGEEAERKRRHTQDWYASHYGKLQDWARKILPEPFSTQFFSCIANGTWDATKDVGKPYMSVGAGMITPSGYIKFNSAQEQILHDQSDRAEAAEERERRMREALYEVAAILQGCDLETDYYLDSEHSSQRLVKQDMLTWLRKFETLRVSEGSLGDRSGAARRAAKRICNIVPEGKAGEDYFTSIIEQELSRTVTPGSGA